MNICHLEGAHSEEGCEPDGGLGTVLLRQPIPEGQHGYHHGGQAHHQEHADVGGAEYCNNHTFIRLEPAAKDYNIEEGRISYENNGQRETVQNKCTKSIGQTFGYSIFLIGPKDAIKLGKVAEQFSQAVQDNQANSNPLEAKGGKKTIIMHNSKLDKHSNKRTLKVLYTLEIGNL